MVLGVQLVYCKLGNLQIITPLEWILDPILSQGLVSDMSYVGKGADMVPWKLCEIQGATYSVRSWMIPKMGYPQIIQNWTILVLKPMGSTFLRNHLISLRACVEDCTAVWRRVSIGYPQVGWWILNLLNDHSICTREFPFGPICWSSKWPRVKWVFLA